ncbi:class I SAM-dependent methyltransferase [uncultured Cohaesibacter sp.]|uniref:class I SAM-dependent methyltransferase n=1 Tax=uncultured Cohaesibacter sp. TaxID=1002546 RepID=UPI0029C8DFD9|nr:class I SAM-dependent methyltransferase [uncultured Cohaesibacter sp.]
MPWAADRPPFCAYTAADLWTRPHIASQMLAHHLDPASDIASRRADTINGIVQWLNERVDLSGKHVCDLGCGPGLYAQRLAEAGAHVTGLDFSANSIAHARKLGADSCGSLRFEVADYLVDALPTNQDLVLLIYADFCALSPAQRTLLLRRMADQLAPGGHIVLDVFSDRLFGARSEALIIEDDLMGGFWAPSPYVGIQRGWLYQDLRLSLDHYLIATPSETFAIYNWLQYFTPESLTTELAANGFETVQAVDMMSGTDLVGDYGTEFGVILSV